MQKIMVQFIRQVISHFRITQLTQDQGPMLHWTPWEETSDGIWTKLVYVLVCVIILVSYLILRIIKKETV